MADINSRLPTSDFADGATGSAAPSEAILVGGTDGTTLRAISTTSTGIVNVQPPIDVELNGGNITVVDTGSTTTSVYGGQVWYTGTATVGSVAAFSVTSQETVMLLIKGTWTGTLQSEVSVDNGTTWLAHSIHLIGSSIFSASFTANVIGSLNISTKNMYRVRAVSAMTGTAQAFIVYGLSPSSIYIANSIKLVDGSSTLSTNMMNIVPASTAVASTNTAIAVGLSPNSPLPSGTNALGTVTAVQATAANLQVTARLNDGSGNAINSTAINSKQRLDVDLASEGQDGSAVPFSTALAGGKDPSGLLQSFITVPSGEQFVRDLLNIAGQNRAQSVTTTAAEALGAATILVNRKVLSITPTNGIIYWGYTSGVTTATGTPIFVNQNFTIAASDDVHIYVIAAATTDARISEGS